MANNLSYGPGKMTSYGTYTGSGTLGQQQRKRTTTQPPVQGGYRGPSQEEMQQKAKEQAEAQAKADAQKAATTAFENTVYDTSGLNSTVSQNMDTLSKQFDSAYDRYKKAMEDAGGKATKYDTAKTDFQKKYVDKVIQGALDSSNSRADIYTNKTAIQAASDTNNKYESVGRAESAQMSGNDDAYQAAAYKAQNLQQNRTNTLQDTINEGQAVLKGLGMETDAAGIAEAQELLDQSQRQMRFSDMFEALYGVLKNESFTTYLSEKEKEKKNKGAS